MSNSKMKTVKMSAAEWWPVWKVDWMSGRTFTIPDETFEEYWTAFHAFTKAAEKLAIAIGGEPDKAFSAGGERPCPTQSAV